MYGGFDSKAKEYSEFFRSKKIAPMQNGRALDLGAGNGFQSIALGGIGFSVTAVDLSKNLLCELEEKKGDLAISVVEGDIRDFDLYSSSQPELIVCMGDTLTHLGDMTQVAGLVANSFRLLPENGKLIFGFRDLSIQLNNEDRFVTVKSEPEKIFTCILEYEPGYVRINDLIYTKNNNSWQKQISSYRKLVIHPEQLYDLLVHSGFKIEDSELINGYVTIIAVKSAGKKI